VVPAVSLAEIVRRIGPDLWSPGARKESWIVRPPVASIRGQKPVSFHYARLGPPMNDEGSKNLMNNITRDYVKPELERRAQSGNPLNEEIWAAQVIFGEGAPAPLIRLNREVRLRAIPVGSDQFEDYVALRDKGARQFTVITLAADEEQLRHMTICQTNVTSSWRIFFSLGDATRQAQPVEAATNFEAGYEPPPPTEWEALYAEHDRVVEAVLAINSPTPNNPIEIVMAVAIQRSRHLLQAYVQLLATKNLTAASALIRMQLDSLMRVNACFLVADPMEIWEVLKTGDPWNRVRSTEGQPLSDSHLHQKLSEKFEWASDLYKQMSGYIHLSRPHLESTTEGENFLGMVIHQDSAGQRVSDHELAENAQLFIRVTRALLQVCNEYAQARRAV
jgi:hypothetical protein